MVKQDKAQEGRSRLKLLQAEIDAGLERYLTLTGVERSQMTFHLLRLRWEKEAPEGDA